MKNLFITIGKFFLELGGFKRIDAAYDNETREMSGMIFSSTESYTSEYYERALDSIK